MKDEDFSAETLEEKGRDSQPTPKLRVPHLFLVFECARPLGGAARYDLSQIEQVFIGRGSLRRVLRGMIGSTRSLDVRVPDAHMSQQHARICRQGDVFFVEDLGSKNGSRVNGLPLRGPLALTDGNVLELGRTLFRFRTGLVTPGSTADVDCEPIAAAPLSGPTLLPELEHQHGTLAKIAGSPVPILLLGESGTGKEVTARAIHDASRRSGPFVAVNCGAIPSTLVEAQLFGHVRGAFSGATRDELGFVRSSHGGTLFLDEIGDLPLASQAALLRVLQEGEVVPVGSAQPIRVDLRVISATHHDLREAIARKTFREDLLARIAGVVHTLLPLRERIEDIGLLVGALLHRLDPERASSVTFTLGGGRALMDHSWPLNIRELQQCLSVALALAGPNPIGVDHLCHEAVGRFPGLRASSAAGADETTDPKDELLRQELVNELAKAQGNITAVARSMGKARMQVQRWLKRLNIDATTFRSS
jgi:transcriptional regulator with AAA-type ATPase domain